MQLKRLSSEMLYMIMKNVYKSTKAQRLKQAKRQRGSSDVLQGERPDNQWQSEEQLSVGQFISIKSTEITKEQENQRMINEIVNWEKGELICGEDTAKTGLKPIKSSFLYQQYYDMKLKFQISTILSSYLSYFIHHPSYPTQSYILPLTSYPFKLYQCDTIHPHLSIGVILFFDNRMFNWLCPCDPSKDHSVLQEYPPIDTLSLHPSHPPQEEDIAIGRATQAETRLMISNQIRQLKPRREQVILPNKDGYLAIDTLRKSSDPNAVFRKIKKSRYEEIVKECARKKEKWTDPDFNYQSKQPIGMFKRITDHKPDATLMVHPVKPTAVKQGRFNNCYWISSISALAEREYRVRALFGSLEVSPWGVYMCKLFFDGIYQEVVVDDFFPFDQTGRYLVGLQLNLTDFWPLVIEKCWAKLYGSYAATEFGYNHTALWALTASPVLGYFQTNYIRNDSGRSFRFLSRLKQHQARNHIINCSVDRRFLAKDVNLQAMHSYSVLGIFETTFLETKVTLLQIRNPLGYFAKNIPPDLRFNNKDSFWETITNEEKDRLEYWRIERAQGQGIFYVEWQDFLIYFNQVAIAQIDDNAHYLYDTIQLNHYKHHYVSLSVDSPGSLYFIVAQQAPLDPLKRLAYATYGLVRVLVAEVTYDSYNRPVFQYVTSSSLTNYEQTNYLVVDLSDLLPGKYLIRVQLLFDTFKENKQQKTVTLGYYGTAEFAVKSHEEVDDCDFLCRTLLSRSKQADATSLHQPLEHAQGWSCIQNILDSNLGYIVFHVEQESQHQQYTITLDESTNEQGFFLEGHWIGRNTLKQTIRKGEEIVIPYTYTWLMANSERTPTFQDIRKKPVVFFRPLYQ